MSSIPEELEQRVAQLSTDEKARLALYLLESLDAVDAGDIEQAWRIEAESRLAAVERGEARTISADEVFADIDRLLLRH